MGVRARLLAACFGLLLTACAPSDTVVVDKLSSIADGAGISYKLDPGTYKVEVTASDDGVTINFVGCSCPGTTTETQNFSTICQLSQTGQVAIDNPTVFGSGKSSTVTIKVTKMGRD